MGSSVYYLTKTRKYSFSRAKIQGFTLIEILVALAIVSIALFAIVKANISNLTIAQHLRDKTIATWVAYDELTRAQLGLIPTEGKTVGDAIMLGQTWHWELRVTALSGSSLKMFDISVSKPADNLILEMSAYA